MANPAYTKIEGQRQGWIKGSVIQKVGSNDFKDWVAVIAVSHSILSPRDIQSGLPTGQRMHKPFVITKELDKATPLLYTALCTNENLKSVEIKFHTPQLRAATGMGNEVNHFTIKLTNANIASIDFRMANIRHADLQKFNEYEELALTYQKIEWTWNDGGITAGDDWEIRS